MSCTLARWSAGIRPNQGNCSSIEASASDASLPEARSSAASVPSDTLAMKRLYAQRTAQPPRARPARTGNAPADDQDALAQGARAAVAPLEAKGEGSRGAPRAGSTSKPKASAGRG